MKEHIIIGCEGGDGGEVDWGKTIISVAGVVDGDGWSVPVFSVMAEDLPDVCGGLFDECVGVLRVMGGGEWYVDNGEFRVMEAPVSAGGEDGESGEVDEEVAEEEVEEGEAEGDGVGEGAEMKRVVMASLWLKKAGSDAMRNEVKAVELACFVELFDELVKLARRVGSDIA